MKPVAHRAHVSLDLAAAKQHGFIRTGEVIFQLRFEALSRLNAARHCSAGDRSSFAIASSTGVSGVCGFSTRAASLPNNSASSFNRSAALSTAMGASVSVIAPAEEVLS